MSGILEYFQFFSVYIWAAYGCTLIGMWMFYLKALRDLKTKMEELKRTKNTLKPQPRAF
jgi:heme exporter protein D